MLGKEALITETEIQSNIADRNVSATKLDTASLNFCLD